ncbi:MAG: LpqB family beta-propeller domain-containing protein [Luteimonas sp.]
MMRVRILGVALLAGLHSAPSAAQSQPAGLAWQLTYSYNMDSAPSPDGRRMVFIRIIEGREQLFAMNTDGTAEVQLTRDAADHEDPAWSPDGRKLAFIRIADGHKRVALMNPDGSGLETLTPEAQHALHPSWTPDSRRILYCTDDDLRPPAKNEAEVYAIDLASRKITTLVSGGVNTFPVMSPDGRHIAYRHMIGEMNSEVFVADADGSHVRNLTNHPSFEGWPAWSPDGRRIAFAANRNSSYQIFVMDADGGNVRLVANTEGRATAPKWSPDGSKIYFTNCRNVDFGRGCEILAAKAPPVASGG